MIDKQIILSLLFCIHFTTNAQTDSRDSCRVFLPEVSYLGDFVSNLRGGIRTGTCYLGMVNIRISFSTEAARLWKGGIFFINGANTHGKEPSAKYIGDYQVTSNIEAGNHTFMQEIWYKQVWKRTEITFGLQDLNVDFAYTSNGGVFMNSSFGILPTISANVPAPIFPMTSLGLSVKWLLSKKISLLTALFDGSPTDFKENPHNLKWEFAKGNGLLFFTELQHETVIDGLPGKFKSGIYFHQHVFAEDDHDGDRDSVYRNNNGFYFLGDQMLWQSRDGSRNFGIFMQLGLSPKKLNTNFYFAGIGVNFSGLFSQQGDDVLGLAVAHDGLRGGTGKETILELMYQFPVCSILFLQPDMQYVINPAGTGKQLDNCLAISLRFGLNL